MANALLRACLHPGCPALVPRGRCLEHQHALEQSRATSTARGYDVHWRRFRARFRRQLLARGITPVCGASLPEGPATSQYSQCQAKGRLQARHLHLDHEPPLSLAERKDWRIVCDPRRVGWLCERCHAAKTAREMQARGYIPMDLSKKLE